MGPAELEGVLSLAIKNVIAGSLTPAVGSSVAALARSLIAAWQSTEIEQRLAELERIAAAQQVPPRRIG